MNDMLLPSVYTENRAGEPLHRAGQTQRCSTHKFLHSKNYESNGYWDFWQKQSSIPGQDCETICGLLDSIRGKLDDDGGSESDSGSGQVDCPVLFLTSQPLLFRPNSESAAKVPRLAHQGNPPSPVPTLEEGNAPVGELKLPEA